MGNFPTNAAKINKTYDELNTATDKVGKGSIGLSGHLTDLGGSLLKVGAIAGGVALAGVAALTGGLVLLGSTALTEFAKYERMSLSVQSLVARDLAQGKQVEQQRTVAISLTKKEAQELEGLSNEIIDEELARNTLHARIKEQSEALRQLRDEQGAGSLEVATATARLEELEHQYNVSGVEIENMKSRVAELGGKEGQLVTVMEKVRTGQMSMTDAMAQAGPQAKELLGWISKLAISSPFSEEGVNQAFQTALAYGFTIDKAKELTAAELDFAAATGKGVETTNQIALALGQMQAKGKVSGQEIIQLTNAGIGVNAILEKMGFTLDDVSAGLVDSDKFIQAVIDDMNVFKGAGAAQANTFSGLISTLSDLKAIGLREFFTGTFTTIQPYLADFVGMMTSAALETGRIRELGDALGGIVATGLQKASTLARNLFSSIQEVAGIFSKFGARGAALNIATQLGITHDAIELLSNFKQFVVDIAGTISNALTPALDSLSSGGALESINSAISFLNENFEALKGAILGLGAVLGAGVIVALGAALFSLLTPINLIIAAAALLGAAWAGNWGNIQGIVLPVIDSLIANFNILMDVFTQFGAMGAGVSILSMLGLSSESIALVTVGIETIKTLLANFSAWWVTNWPIMQAVALTAWQIIQGIFVGFQNVVAIVGPQLQQSFNQITQTLASLGISWGDVWNAIKTATGIVAAGIGALLLGLVSVIGGVATSISSGISAAVSVISTLIDQLTTALTGIMQVGAGSIAFFQALIAGDWTMAWRSFVLVVEGVVNTVKGLFGAITTAMTAPFIVIVENIKGFAAGITAVFSGLYNTLVGHSIIPDLVNDIGMWFAKIPQMIVSALSSVVDKIVKPFEEAQEVVADVLSTLGDLSEEILPPLEKGLDAVSEAIKTATGYFNSLAEAVASFTIPDVLQYHSPPPLAQAFTDIASSANVASQAVSNFMAGMGGAQASQAMATAKSILDSFKFSGLFQERGLGGAEAGIAKDVIKDVFFPNIGAILAGTLSEGDFLNQVLSQIGDRLGTGIGIVRTALGSRVDDLFGQLRSQLGNASGQLSQQLSQMAGNFASIGSAFAEALKAQIGRAMEAIKKIREESTKLAEDNKKLTETNKELGKSNTELTNTLTGQQTQLNTLQQELEVLNSQEVKDTVAINAKKQAIRLLIAEMKRNELSILQNNRAMEANLRLMGKNEAAVAKLRKELGKKALRLFDIGATQEQLQEGSAAMVELLRDFLRSGEETFRLSGEELGINFTTQAFNDEVIFNQIEARQELNRLLREQRQQQEEILRIEKAQADLAFLQQQISLLNMIQQLGVDPADILGGITLGLGANIQDLLNVTSNIVEAMVNQINADLEIHSPSGVTELMGSQFMAGFPVGFKAMVPKVMRGLQGVMATLQQGIVSMAPGLNAQLQASIAGPAMVSGPLGGGGATYNYNNNFGNNTYQVSNGYDVAALDAHIVHVIRRELGG